MDINVGDYLELCMVEDRQKNRIDWDRNEYRQEQILYKSSAPEYGDITIYTGFSRHPEWHLTAQDRRDLLYGWYTPGYLFRDEVW